MIKKVKLPDNKDITCRDICEDLMNNIAMLPLKDNPELQEKVRKAWQE